MIRLLRRSHAQGLTTLGAWIVGSALLAASLPTAVGGIFVKIPQVEGHPDVDVEGYDDGRWFLALSGGYSSNRELPTKGAGTEDLSLGPGQISPLSLTFSVGPQTAPLMKAAITGNMIGDVEIHLADVVPGEEGNKRAQVFAMIKLRRTFVESFSTSGDADAPPMCDVTLVFNGLEMTQFIPDPQGELADQRWSVAWNKMADLAQLFLLAPSAFPDADGDGMSDDFENTHFGSPTGGDPLRDSDNDGVSDRDEFYALTDPHDPESAFEAALEPDDQGGEGMAIRIKTEPGRVYQLRATDNLGIYFLLGSVTGDGTVMDIVDPRPGPRRFYQVEIFLAQ